MTDWFTLADAPINRIAVPSFGCYVCGEPVSCEVSIGVSGRRKTWRSCSEHLENVMAELAGGK